MEWEVVSRKKSRFKPKHHIRVNEHLCHECNQIFEKARHIWRPPVIEREDGGASFMMASQEDKEYFLHKPSFSDFIDSASSGCHLCSLFLLQVNPDHHTQIVAHRPADGVTFGRMHLQRNCRETAAAYEICLSYPMPINVVEERKLMGSLMKLHLCSSRGQRCQCSQRAAIIAFITSFT